MQSLFYHTASADGQGGHYPVADGLFRCCIARQMRRAGLRQKSLTGLCIFCMLSVLWVQTETQMPRESGMLTGPRWSRVWRCVLFRHLHCRLLVIALLTLLASAWVGLMHNIVRTRYKNRSQSGRVLMMTRSRSIAQVNIGCLRGAPG